MNLATIQRIKSLEPIPNYDRIVLAKMEGVAWQCVVGKDDFKVGDLGVYFSVDNLVDTTNPALAFMIARKNRVRSCKFKSVFSQGLLMPLSILSYWTPETQFVEGQDVTEVTKTIHWENPENWNISSDSKGSLPAFLRKSDELNLKSYNKVWDELVGLEVYSRQKTDGSSFKAFFNNGNFGVCSRSFEKKESENCAFWRAAKLYDLPNKLPKLGKNICIAAECCGSKLNGNKMGLGTIDLFVYDVWDIDAQKYLGYDDASEIIKSLELKECPLYYRGPFKWNSLEDLQKEINELKYENGEWIEGVVIRPVTEKYSPVLDGRLSVKLINENFAVKFGI